MHHSLAQGRQTYHLQPISEKMGHVFGQYTGVKGYKALAWGALGRSGAPWGGLGRLGRPGAARGDLGRPGAEWIFSAEN